MLVRVEIAVDPRQSRFRHFWAKRVTGFTNSTHCSECLRGSRMSGVNKELAQGGRTILNAKAGSLIYVCGVASPRNWSNNFHLAFRVAAGEQITSQFYTGAAITVSNAVALPISDQMARELFPELSEDFLSCRNFQFGAQAFGRRDQ